MTDYQSPRKEREDRANRILLAAVVGLVVLAVLAVAFASLKPAGKVRAPAREESAVVVASAPKPPAAAQPVNSPDTTQTTAPVAALTPKPSPPTKAAPMETTVPEKMAALPTGTRQIIVITGDKIGSNSGRLALYDKTGTTWTEVMNVAANFGKNGLVDGEKRQQGNLQTPTGIWTIGSFLFGLHPSPPAGTLMPYRPITDRLLLEQRARLHLQHLGRPPRFRRAPHRRRPSVRVRLQHRLQQPTQRAGDRPRDRDLHPLLRAARQQASASTRTAASRSRART